jgi:hypothetical protein
MRLWGDDSCAEVEELKGCRRGEEKKRGEESGREEEVVERVYIQSIQHRHIT